MDDEMVDRVALAILRRTCEHYGDPMPATPDLSLTRLLAIAAIEALRDPTPAMIAAVSDDPNMRDAVAETWRRMAEAAGQ
jgi:hypothetical protein